MKKYTASQIIKDRISIKLDTEEQHTKTCKLFGVVNRIYYSKYKYYRFYPIINLEHDCYGKMDESYLNYHDSDINCSFEITFDQIDFEERKPDGYIVPMDYYGDCVPKLAVVRKRDDFYHYNGYPFPPELVETWEPYYKEQKIRVEAGEYNKDDIQKLLNQFK